MIGELSNVQEYVIVQCDSQSIIQLTNHHIYHDRMKHINIRLHFVRDAITSEEVMIEKIASQHMCL